MATANDVTRRAMKIARVLATGQNPSAEEYVDNLSILNSMLSAWAKTGINLNCPALSNVTVLPVDDADIEPICYNLAMRLYPEYGKPIDPAVAQMASEGLMWLRNRYFVIARASLNLPEPDAIAPFEIEA